MITAHTAGDARHRMSTEERVKTGVLLLNHISDFIPLDQNIRRHSYTSVPLAAPCHPFTHHHTPIVPRTTEASVSRRYRPLKIGLQKTTHIIPRMAPTAEF